MKKTKILMMLTAVVLLSSCMSDDATDTYKDFINNWGNNGNGTITSASGELSTFEVAIDKETAEPTDVATATYPEASDAISTQQFTKMVTIDMSNPVEKTENGVTITVVDGKDITTDHGKTEGVCYVAMSLTSMVPILPAVSRQPSIWIVRKLLMSCLQVQIS